MLFLKNVSDVWRDHYEQYKHQFGADEERLLRRMKNEKFVLPPGADYYSLYEKRGADNLGELIDMALAKIEEANIGKLQGVFRNISFNSEAAFGQTKQRNARLKFRTVEDCAEAHRILAGTIILGDLTIQDNIKGLLSLNELLTRAMENGALRALIPVSNKS
jgi:type I restriction-modification system DNA methylase subunit